jgi:hypothetical protein
MKSIYDYLVEQFLANEAPMGNAPQQMPQDPMAQQDPAAADQGMEPPANDDEANGVVEQLLSLYKQLNGTKKDLLDFIRKAKDQEEPSTEMVPQDGGDEQGLDSNPANQPTQTQPMGM